LMSSMPLMARIFQIGDKDAVRSFGHRSRLDCLGDRVDRPRLHRFGAASASICERLGCLRLRDPLVGLPLRLEAQKSRCIGGFGSGRTWHSRLAPAKERTNLIATSLFYSKSSASSRSLTNKHSLPCATACASPAHHDDKGPTSFPRSASGASHLSAWQLR